MTTVTNKICMILCLIVLMLSASTTVSAQLSLDINMAMIDGIDIKASNVLQYSIYSQYSTPQPITITGVISYRNSENKLSYRLKYDLQPGNNTFSDKSNSAEWSYSSTALRDLFFRYDLLPQGTYQYCVTVSIDNNGEVVNGSQSECVYRHSEDLFMITLMEPENDAKIYEYNPMLSWIVNYPFANELTYKLRLAEIKKGQNTANAITRNNPIYSEKNIVGTSITYPVYAKQLVAYQPYAWTVDAYYRGILLGGAEPWKFTIIEDTLKMEDIPKDVSYLDINKEKTPNAVFAIGKLKLKYELRVSSTDTLNLDLALDGKEVKLKENKLAAVHGDNRYAIDFTEQPKLKHGRTYKLMIRSQLGEEFIVVFKYVNPDLFEVKK